MPAPSIRPRRSFIFTPGLRSEIFPKALATGADIVCVELEDGIAPKDKAAARTNALRLFESPQADDGVERIVRVRRIIAEFEAADTGLVVIDGKLIEKPVLREMHRIVAIANRIGAAGD
ncbi:MAG: aldolase/citrate lyase family protein [Rhodospirillales bacterium]|nr:aldolase/citrate lyase family protein [Rhodospirillales bacterium]